MNLRSQASETVGRGIQSACLLAVLIPAACGPKTNTVAQLDLTGQNLQRLGAAYSEATIRLARPPQNREELLPYLGKQGQAAELLRSANDGEELVIHWGVDLRTQPENKMPVLAYEKVGKDNKRHVLQGRSTVVLLTAEELRAAPFPPGSPPPP